MRQIGPRLRTSVGACGGAVWIYAAAQLICLVALCAVSAGGTATWVSALPMVVSAAVAAVAVTVGRRRYRPGVRGGWWWLAAGQTMFAAAEACQALQQLIAATSSQPSPADVLFVAAYPLFAVGLFQFVRRRTPGWDLPSLLDAAIIAVGAGLLGWIHLVDPLASNDVLSTAAKVLQGTYPLMDLVLLVLAARLLLGSSTRPLSLVLVIAAIILLLGADTGYALTDLLDPAAATSAGTIGWLCCYALLGTAALHPSMVRLDEQHLVQEPDAGFGRLFALTVAVVTAPAVQVIQVLSGDDPHVLLCAATTVIMLILVMIRMAGVVTTQRVTATTDALTGLKTRRYLEQRLAAEARRTDRPTSLLIVDVDYFKRINDTYGHPGGDRVLADVARRLSAAMTANAVVARYGGEEFAVLLPAADHESAASAAETARRAIADTPFTAGPALITVTASVGGACLPRALTTAQELVSNADRALYRAKNTGRDRTVMHPQPAQNQRPTPGNGPYQASTLSAVES